MKFKPYELREEIYMLKSKEYEETIILTVFGMYI